MVWFKVDDGLVGNKKFSRIPRSERMPAIGLWTTLGAWCAHELTDGVVESQMVEEVGGTSDQSAWLVKAGLWEECTDGYRYVNWHEYQPTRTAVEADRSAAKDRQQRARDRARDKREQDNVTPPSRRDDPVTNGVTHPLVTPPSQESSGVVTVPPTRPDPTRPLEDVAALALAPNAGMLVREWIESCPSRPPTNVVGQIAKQVKQLLDVDHINHTVISQALTEWQSKDLHPSVLPSIVHGIQSAPSRPSKQQKESDDFLSRAMARAQAKMGEPA